MDMMDLMILLLLALPTPALSVRREFHFVDVPKNWTEAQSYCREKFYDLVTIESAEDWARVSKMVENSGETDVWIGLYDDVNSWRWSLDNTNLYDQESWFDFSANNDGGNQHCVDVNEYQLQDNDCDTPEKSVCYDESSNSYISVTDPKTWQDAQSYCRQTYTDLASIRNQQEWNNIMSTTGYLQEQNNLLSDSNLLSNSDSDGDGDAPIITPGRHWIGLSRESWKWSDQSNSSFRQWADGQPHGGDDICGGVFVNGLFDDTCDAEFPFICSAPQRKVVKVTLKTSGSVNLNDPLVQEAILKQMEKDLRGQGVNQEFRLSWRKQPHGDVFNKTEL